MVTNHDPYNEWPGIPATVLRKIDAMSLIGQTIGTSSVIANKLANPSAPPIQGVLIVRHSVVEQPQKGIA